MKTARFILAVLLALGVLVSFSGMSIADCGKCEKGKKDKESCDAAVKVLQDSAAALQGTNPELAKGLTDCANEKAKKMQEWQERKARYEAKAKLLADAAAALEKTNPDLAKSLKEMSEHKYDKMMHEMKEEENEKD